MCFMECLELWYATDKLGESWSVEYELVEELNVTFQEWRREESTQATRSSKDSLTPSNLNWVREGGIKRVCRGEVACLSQSEIEAIGTQARVFRDWSTWKGE